MGKAAGTAGKDWGVALACEGEIEGVEVDEFLACLVLAALAHGEIECGKEAHLTRAPFGGCFIAEEVGRERGLRERGEFEWYLNLDREVRVHVPDSGSLLADQSGCFLVRGLAVMRGGAAGETDGN